MAPAQDESQVENVRTEQSLNAAFYALTEIARILRGAVHNQEEFTVDIRRAGGDEGSGYNIHIQVRPRGD